MRCGAVEKCCARAEGKKKNPTSIELIFVTPVRACLERVLYHNNNEQKKKFVNKKQCKRNSCKRYYDRRIAFPAGSYLNIFNTRTPYTRDVGTCAEKRVRCVPEKARVAHDYTHRIVSVEYYAWV